MPKLSRKPDNVRTNTESVQCHYVFDIAYLASSLRGHVTSSITWPYDSPYPFFIGAPLWPRPYLQPFWRYWAFNWVTTLTFLYMTWRHRSRHQSIPHRPFAIGCLLVPSLYLLTFSRYSTPKIRAHAHKRTPQVILYSVPCNVLQWTDNKTCIFYAPRCTCIHT